MSSRNPPIDNFIRMFWPLERHLKESRDSPTKSRLQLWADVAQSCNKWAHASLNIFMGLALAICFIAAWKPIVACVLSLVVPIGILSWFLWVAGEAVDQIDSHGIHSSEDLKVLCIAWSLLMTGISWYLYFSVLIWMKQELLN